MEIKSKNISLHAGSSSSIGSTKERKPTQLNIRYFQPTTAAPSAPTVLFLPFWGGSASTFEQVQFELSKTHASHTSIAVSYHGTGASRRQKFESASNSGDDDAPEDHDIPALVADVLALLGSLGPDGDEALNLIPSGKIVVCAHSMSAKVAWEVLGGLVDSKAISMAALLLLAPAPPGPLELAAEMREQQLKAYQSIESATWTLKNVLTHKELDDAVIERLAKDCVEMSPGAKRGWIELGMRRSCADTVNKVAARLLAEGLQADFPVSILAGEHDKVETTERVQKESVEVLRSLGFAVTFKVVPGIGHLLPVETPEDVAVSLGKLL